MAVLPNAIGIQKIIIAFTTIPLLIAMTFVCVVLFVENINAV